MVEGRRMLDFFARLGEAEGLTATLTALPDYQNTWARRVLDRHGRACDVVVWLREDALIDHIVDLLVPGMCKGVLSGQKVHDLLLQSGVFIVCVLTGTQEISGFAGVNDVDVDYDDTLDGEFELSVICSRGHGHLLLDTLHAYAEARQLAQYSVSVFAMASAAPFYGAHGFTPLEVDDEQMRFLGDPASAAPERARELRSALGMDPSLPLSEAAKQVGFRMRFVKGADGGGRPNRRGALNAALLLVCIAGAMFAA